MFAPSHQYSYVSIREKRNVKLNTAFARTCYEEPENSVSSPFSGFNCPMGL